MRLSSKASMISERFAGPAGLDPSVTARSPYNPPNPLGRDDFEAGDDVSGPGLAVRGHAGGARSGRACRRRDLWRGFGRAGLRPLGALPAGPGGATFGDRTHPAGDAGGRHFRVARLAAAAVGLSPGACRPQPRRVQRPGRRRARSISGRRSRSCDFRGEAMQRAVPAGTGRWPRSLASTTRSIEAACAEAAQGDVVQPVNYNAPASSSSRAAPPRSRAPSRPARPAGPNAPCRCRCRCLPTAR